MKASTPVKPNPSAMERLLTGLQEFRKRAGASAGDVGPGRRTVYDDVYRTNVSWHAWAWHINDWDVDDRLRMLIGSSIFCELNNKPLLGCPWPASMHDLSSSPYRLDKET